MYSTEIYRTIFLARLNGKWGPHTRSALSRYATALRAVCAPQKLATADQQNMIFLLILVMDICFVSSTEESFTTLVKVDAYITDRVLCDSWSGKN